MLVYGDPSRELELYPTLDRIRRRAAQRPASLDTLRELLIEAGQLEQAVADSEQEVMKDRDAVLRTAIALTDHAARAFVSVWQDGSSDNHQSGPEFALDCPRHFPNVRLRAKVPEGFAFYALYPEQYCAAAAQWLDRQRADATREVLVVGVRSIGTSLSAVVAATLARGGWGARRTTVRPIGHPFDRQVDLHGTDVAGARHAIVVDEGPGLSGSSMSACAKALIAAGLPRQAISFFPGHERMPGSAASAEIRSRWESTPRYVAALTALRWDGHSLADLLRGSTERLCGRPASSVEDLSAGHWRRVVYPDKARWPAVGATFERMKLRVILDDGSSVLWKFAGLCDTGKACRQDALAEKGFTLPPLGRAMGFVASPWVEGEHFTRENLDSALLDRIAAYIRAVARPPLESLEGRGAFERLREMVRVNVAEALGESSGRGASAIADGVAPLIEASNLPAYGDGRLAPHEWVRTREGGILKLDCGGHDADHTIVGPQPLLWDVAGTVVEWAISRSDRRALLNAMGLSNDDELLTFYELAYAAFRVGFCTLCAQMAETEEKGRLTRARADYLRCVVAML
jgi:hypothetical protein